MKKITKFILVCIFILCISAVSYAQTVEISGQFRPRFEFRNGYSTLIPEGEQPANFISQRTRLNLKFSNEKFKIGFAIQNIGVWGETGTVSRSDVNGTMLHEAWGQIIFSEMISVKVGRQEIIYDDQRIFGNVDWAQQARRHDAAIVMLTPHEECHLDIGIAYNALSETRFKEYYTINNYKALQYAHWHRVFSEFTASILLLNNGLPYRNIQDTTSSGKIKEKIAYSQTFGGRTTYARDNLKANGALYFQTGKIAVDTNNNNINESTRKLFGFYFAADVNYALNDVFALGGGFEFLSGNSMKDPHEKEKAFKPLYGTNHKFNGFMDYFYVGNHMNSVGLFDIFIPVKFKKNKFSASFIPHFFFSAAQVYGLDENGQVKDFSSFLGTEVDIVASYQIANSVSVAAGYSHMFASKSMEIIKSTPDPRSLQNWAWIMINIKPTFFTSKNNQ